MNYNDYNRSRRARERDTSTVNVPHQSTRIIVPPGQAEAFIAFHQQSRNEASFSSSSQVRAPEQRTSFALPMPTASTADIDNVYSSKGLRTTFVALSSIDRDTSTYPYASDFRIQLPRILKSITRIRLISLELQNPERTISSLNNSISFTFDNGQMYSYTIPPGNWSAAEVAKLIQAELLTLDPYLLFFCEINSESQRTSLRIFRMDSLKNNPIRRISDTEIVSFLPTASTYIPRVGETVTLIGLHVVPDGAYTISNIYESANGTQVYMKANVESQGEMDAVGFGGAKGWMGVPVNCKFDFSPNGSIGRTLGFFKEETSSYVFDYASTRTPPFILDVKPAYISTEYQTGQSQPIAIFLAQTALKKLEDNKILNRGQIIDVRDNDIVTKFEVLDYQEKTGCVWIRNLIQSVNANTLVFRHGPLPPLMNATSSIFNYLSRFSEMDVNTVVFQQGENQIRITWPNISNITHDNLNGQTLLRTFWEPVAGSTPLLSQGKYMATNLPDNDEGVEMYLYAQGPLMTIDRFDTFNGTWYSRAQGYYVFWTFEDPKTWNVSGPVMLPMPSERATRYYLQSEELSCEGDHTYPASVPLDFGVTENQSGIAFMENNSNLSDFPFLIVMIKKDVLESHTWLKDAKMGHVMSLRSTQPGDYKTYVTQYYEDESLPYLPFFYRSNMNGFSHLHLVFKDETLDRYVYGGEQYVALGFDRFPPTDDVNEFINDEEVMLYLSQGAFRTAPDNDGGFEFSFSVRPEVFAYQIHISDILLN